MDAVDLNNSPELTMVQITKQLFNNEYMSDVEFRVEGKVLFAHSWELMKRSIVFREQFRGNLGDNKLIPIDDISYDAFYQFLHFIYTDECTAELKTRFELLKLSVRYKIVKLENKILNLKIDNDSALMLFEYCSANKYELFYNYVFGRIIESLNILEDTNKLLEVTPNALEAILKSNHMPSGMTEVLLFNTLVRWMNKSCEINQTPITQRRANFDKLFRLIRFPLMTIDEFKLCAENHPDLFTSGDHSAICTQIVLRHNVQSEWLTEPRLEYSTLGATQEISSNRKWQTQFTVSDNLILLGLTYGSGWRNSEIQISSTNDTDGLKFNFVKPGTNYNTISLGESIKLKPNVKYTIEIKYNKIGEKLVYCRTPNVNLIVTGPSNFVTVTEASDNLFEIIFKLPTT